MKHELKVGDRVRVYGNSFSGDQIDKCIGTLHIQSLETGWWWINIKNRTYSVHERQCVRIKPKPKLPEPREVWVKFWKIGPPCFTSPGVEEKITSFAQEQLKPDQCWVKFREVVG